MIGFTRRGGLETLAQGFSPGLVRQSSRPERAADVEPLVTRHFDISENASPALLIWLASIEVHRTTHADQPVSAAPSGRISWATFPGLKPWAVIYSRFAANPTHSCPACIGSPNAERQTYLCLKL